MRVGYACDVNTLRDGLAAVTKFAATLLSGEKHAINKRNPSVIDGRIFDL